MKRYVVTGAPGTGKTSIVRELARLGYAVVAEAATDVIAAAQALGDDEPWRGSGFVDTVVAMQRRRQQTPAPAGATAQVYDRSPICTLALAWYLDRPVTESVAAEIDRVVQAGFYQRRVFLVRPIGFVRATAARRISFEDSLRFERLHEQAYRANGFELVDIAGGTVAERVAEIDRHIRSWTPDAVR